MGVPPAAPPRRGGLKERRVPRPSAAAQGGEERTGVGVGESNTGHLPPRTKIERGHPCYCSGGERNTQELKTEMKLRLGDGTQSPLSEGQRLEPGISSAPRTAPGKTFSAPAPPSRPPRFHLT